MSVSYLFGFLSEPVSVDAGDVMIRPVDEFEQRLKDLEPNLNRDGYYYPGPSHTVTVDSSGLRGPIIPGTRRPTHLFFLEPSHLLTLAAPQNPATSDGDASFLVQLLAYVYGTRLQLDGFQFDGRIPLQQKTHHVHVGKLAFNNFIATAYVEWLKNPPDRQLRLINILYMHSKAPSYDWIWEQFLIEYLVTDAIYDFCSRAWITAPVGHAQRIGELCSRLGLWCPSAAPIDSIVNTRNELFHEARWEGERPGYRISQEAYDGNRLLRSLNQRLIAALFGGVRTYASSSWEDWRSLHDFA